ncbi:MAG: polyamine aminopropyltransferase [Victivallaceae bacterium]|nr:polyamine aminopropyltransferase [Victivallaceae bacterium]
MEPGEWVTEAAAGFGMTVEIREKLCCRKSQFQTIEVYETAKLGRLLMLDGIIQLTSFDEFAYHEMMANVPLFAHGGARRVLVIGGGDGGVLRELGRHPELEELDICEIDREVIAAAREFLPGTACGFDDPRVRVHIADGSVFVRDKAGYYDVIIVDSTDPGGPGAPLFNQDFYRDLKRALRPGGVIATQSESPFLLPELVARLNAATRACFRYAGYASIMVPTYPTGMIGMSVGSDGRDVTEPALEVPPELARQLRYYNTAMHRAAFARPNFVQDMTGGR